MKSDAGCWTASTLGGTAPASACAWASVGSSTLGRGSSGAASVSIVAPVATSDAAPSAAPLKNSRRPTGLLPELADESATDHLLKPYGRNSLSVRFSLCSSRRATLQRARLR